MRIITGIARGFRLNALPGNHTRPTTGRVKEAIFSAVQFELEGRRVLDLFAGSGQMGLEALSRGAGQCVFVDLSAKAAEVIRGNLASLNKCYPGFDKRAKVINGDVLSYLEKDRDFYDIVFIDPPYASGLLLPALLKVEPRVNRGGVIVCESDADSQLPEVVGDFRMAKEYNYGRVCVRLYRQGGNGQ